MSDVTPPARGRACCLALRGGKDLVHRPNESLTFVPLRRDKESPVSKCPAKMDKQMHPPYGVAGSVDKTGFGK